MQQSPNEQKYVIYLSVVLSNELRVSNVTGCQVNLSGAIMMMRQPFTCPVRRNFLSGIQVEFKQSLHQRSLRAQLHWLQVTHT